MIRLAVPDLDQHEIDAVADVLRSGYLVQGPRVAQFEQAMAERVGVKHAIAVSSGTAALHLALLSLDIGQGDIVVTTCYSWPATANVIELCGAETRFVDICPSDLNLDVQQLGAICSQLESDPATRGRTKAIMPVHAFGMPANMDAIIGIANEHGLHVVEDAACALGSTWAGKPCGSWGALGCFSLHPRKAITTGEGGIITTDDDQLAHRLKVLRNHGLSLESGQADFVEPGFNYRLTEIGAAIGNAQMEKLSGLIEARREKSAVYNELFSGSAVRTPSEQSQAYSVYQSYVVQLPSAIENRLVIDQLRERGIEATIGTYHIAMTSAFRTRYGFALGDFPAADQARTGTVTLPLHHLLTGDDQERVANELLAIVASHTVDCS